MTKLLSFLLLCHYCLWCVASYSLPKIILSDVLADSGERVFLDEEFKRQRLFHGTNAIVKGIPWVPATDVYSSDISMVEEDFQQLQSMGMNMIRLGVMWPGVEPEPNKYNYTYLSEIKKIVDGASKYGIYTLLDMHQDGISEYFCGEGIPYWAVRQTREFKQGGIGSFPGPFDKLDNATDYYVDKLYPGPNYPRLPSRKACNTKNLGPGWHEVTFQSSNAYEALYKNVDGMLDKWAMFWQTVALYFKGNSNVLGLELINEPFAGDLYADPLIMIPYPNPSSGDRTRLEPAYAKLNAAIRSVDEERLIFFAGTTWDDLGAGFQAAPGGPEFANRSVLAYHYYEPPQENTKFQIKEQVAAARRLGTASFLTETGGGTKGGESIYQAADEKLQSWSYWEYKSFCRESNSTKNGLSQNGLWGACKTGYGPNVYIYRTYAKAVSGNIQSMVFNTTDKTFTLKFETNSACTMCTTEIALSPKQNYPNGLKVEIQPSSLANYSYNPDANPFLLNVTTKPTSNANNITVKITPL